MNVALLNTKDEGGGAARAAYRLHCGLKNEKGVSPTLFVRDKQSADEAVRAYQPDGGLWTRIRRRWRQETIQRAFQSYQSSRPDDAELFSDDRAPYDGRVARQCPAADVVNLHWISDFVDVGSFLERVSVPVVWTLHDMNAFTGGCHYSVGCKRYQEACGQCPQLGSEEEEDLSRSIWKRKRAAYRPLIQNHRLCMVSPSEWLAEEARRSPLLKGGTVEVIPNGVDSTTFRPRETEGLRTALDVPDHHRIVLFVAQFSENRRKGFRLLKDALSGLSVENVTLMSIGGGTPTFESGIPHRHLGRLESDLLLSIFYSLADLFVIPSRQDNLPNTVLESLACGTPVVGFDTGGIPDMVRPNETGWLAETGNVRSLRNVLERALADDAERRRKSNRSRKVVQNEYTLEIQARAYRRLYNALLSKHDETPT